jgi:hypothetical protein
MDNKDYVPAFRTLWLVATAIMVCGTVYMFYTKQAVQGFPGSGRFAHGGKGYLNAYGLAGLTFFFLLAGIGIFWPVKKKNNHGH